MLNAPPNTRVLATLRLPAPNARVWIEGHEMAPGGTATPPVATQPDIAGAASANFDITPLLTTGADTNVETTPGRGTYGFQGDFS